MAFGDHKVPNWPKTKEGWCKYYKLIDEKFDTDKLSPLHHDNCCPIHGRKQRDLCI